VAPGVRSIVCVKNKPSADKSIAIITCSVGVDLSPRLFHSFDSWFLVLCFIDRAGRGLVKEVLRMLPQRAVFDGDNLRGGSLS
jgi:hypothetical protein